MSKYIMIIATLIITFISNPVSSFAHSHLEGSTPADGEVVNYSLDVITLKFNTDINEGSTITVTNDKGEQFEVSSVAIQGHSMLAQLPESLPSGSYTVYFEIIGEDSHVVDGDFTFTVKVDSTEQKEEETTEPEQGTEDPTTDQQADNTKGDTTTSENQATQPETEEGLSNSMIAIAAVLIIAGLGLLWWMLRKKGSE